MNKRDDKKWYTAGHGENLIYGEDYPTLRQFRDEAKRRGLIVSFCDFSGSPKHLANVKKELIEKNGECNHKYCDNPAWHNNIYCTTHLKTDQP